MRGECGGAWSSSYSFCWGPAEILAFCATKVSVPIPLVLIDEMIKLDLPYTRRRFYLRVSTCFMPSLYTRFIVIERLNVLLFFMKVFEKHSVIVVLRAKSSMLSFV